MEEVTNIHTLHTHTMDGASYSYSASHWNIASLSSGQTQFNLKLQTPVRAIAILFLVEEA